MAQGDPVSAWWGAAEAGRGDFRADLDRLVEDVRASLAERNAAIHSIAVTDIDDTGEFVAIFWHPKSDREGPADSELLNAQVRRMGVLGARTNSHERAAAAWRGALEPAVTAAALVLSVLALVVAVASVVYTRRQASATEGSRAVEAERRHAELVPDLGPGATDR